MQSLKKQPRSDQGKPRKLADWELAELIHRCKHGESFTRIAQDYGISPRQVSRIYRRAEQ